MFRKKGIYTEASYNPSTKKVTIGFGNREGKAKNKITFNEGQFKEWLERINAFAKGIE